MARFYRTSNATPIDYMYRMNTPLMAQVLGANDQYIDQELDQSNKLGAFSFNYIPGDAEDANRILDDYHTQANNIASTIAKDPANWRKQQGAIKDLTNKLQTDYSSGAISKYVTNYNNRKAAFDNLDQQVALYNKTGGVDKNGNAIGISPENAAAYKAELDSNFNGTKYIDPSNYNVYKTKTFMNDMNVKKVIADGIDKMKADSNIEYHSNPVGNDWYIDKTTNKRVELTPDRILQVAMSNMNDPKLMSYMKQLTDAKLATGVFDENGKFIAPYQNTNYQLTPEDQQNIEKQKALISQVKDDNKRKALMDTLNSQVDQLKNKQVLQWNNNSYFAPILQGIIGKNAYSQTESGNDLKNNSKGSTLFNAGQAWARQSRQLQQSQNQFEARQKQQKDEFDQRLAEDKRATDLKNSKSTTKSTSSTSTIPDQTTVSHFDTRSLASDMTNDKNGNRVLKFSNAGLVGDIENNKSLLQMGNAKIKVLDQQLRTLPPDSPEYQSAKLMKNQLQLQMQTAQKNLDDSRYYYNAVTDKVLNNGDGVDTKLKPDEVALYKEFSNDRDANKITQEIENARKKYPDVPDRVFSIGPGAVGQQTYKLSPQVQALLDKRSKYLSVKKQVDNNREAVLDHLRNNTVIDSDAIKPNKQESDQLSDMITSNMDGLRIFDASTGKTPDKDLSTYQWLHNQKPQTMTFAGGGDNLQSYIRDNKVKMNVLNIGPTTAIGDGHAVAQVTFDDPNGKIPKDKVYVVELNDRLQNTISDRYSKSTNPEIANIGRTLGSSLDNSIRAQLAPLNTNSYFNGDKGGTNERTITIQVPDANGKMGRITMERFADGALHGSWGGVSQFFKNTDDFIQQYTNYLNKAKGK